MNQVGAAGPQLFMADDKPLTPCDAVAAIVTANGRYLMQLRDDHGGIFYPDHWGLFGGGIEPGENETDALIRELGEELGLAVAADEIRRFSTFKFDFFFAGGASVIRAFYEVPLEPARLKALRLREGRRMDLLKPAEALDPARKVAPYDAFAVWLHANRKRLDFVAAKRPPKAAKAVAE
jgi:8-oxo-dGTP pyrophosphatase MutT (NUDIX family)